jgi:hypothetical protein
MPGYKKLKPKPSGPTWAGARPGYRWFWSRRQKKKKAPTGPSGAVLPTVAEVVDHDFLLEVFDRQRREKGQAPGPDGLSYRAFGHSEIAWATRVLEKCVLDGSYQPYKYRSVFIPKRDGKRRELKLRNVLDRLVAAALYEKCRAYWETVFLPRSYGFRPADGLKWATGVWPLLADLMLTVRETGLSVLAVDDVKKAFDSLDIKILLHYHAQHVHAAALLAFIEKVLRGGDVAKLRGIDQGSAYSPLALNIFLHFAHDVALSGGHTHPLWWRYADNLVYLTQSVPEAHQVLKEVRHRLGEARLSLKGTDGPPVDLKGGKAELLGFDLSLDKGQDVTLSLSADALDDIKQLLMEAHETESPSAAAHMATRGWVNAYGPALGTLTDSDTLADILKAAADCGFREMLSREILKQLVGGAWKTWCSCLKTAEHRRLATTAPVDT